MSTSTLAPTTPFQPYASLFQKPNGPGDARPTAQQIILDRFPPPTTATALKGRVILITGASSGIGVETARALYSAGAELYLGARDLGKLQGVIDDIVSTHKSQDESNSYTPPVPQKLELHLDSLSQIRTAAADFLKRSNNTLHILINNAGVMACPLNRTKDGFEMQFGTNHLGHFLLYTLLEPALLSSAELSGQTSRVVNLSSAGHRMSPVRFPDWNFTANSKKSSPGEKEENADYEKWTSYGQSKTANIWMASAIQRRHGSGKKPLITALSVHPGGIQTELGRHMDESDYERLNLKDFAAQYKSIPQGAATTVWAAVAEHFESGENGGRYLEDCGEAGPKQSDTLLRGGFESWAYDEQGSERLWKESEEAVKA
jgi:NAD(P)-dependent dehydrogenase (short-subunit alcohol dehydrogenase family)